MWLMEKSDGKRIRKAVAFSMEGFSDLNDMGYEPTSHYAITKVEGSGYLPDSILGED